MPASNECSPFSFHSLTGPPAACPSNPFPSSLQVRYVFKPHFGELPPYLQQRKKELAAQREAAERTKMPPQVGRQLGGWVAGGPAIIRHKWGRVASQIFHDFPPLTHRHFGSSA